MVTASECRCPQGVLQLWSGFSSPLSHQRSPHPPKAGMASSVVTGTAPPRHAKAYPRSPRRDSREVVRAEPAFHDNMHEDVVVQVGY
jgi:hypothetical protein